jgi:ribosomal protein L4
LNDQELFHELSFYTLAHSDPAFIHQNAVDAYTAQHADETTKPIAVVFALIGLYLHLERSFTGKQVQRAHMKMARRRKQWPRLSLPVKRARITVADVVAAAPGRVRDEMIRAWCASVWEVWQDSREKIAGLAKTELDVD